jgi:nitrogen fixation/metabolism regulation signal transduction histidine kinase
MILVVAITIGIVVYPMLRDMMPVNDLNIQYAAAQKFLAFSRLMPAMAVLFSFFVIHQLIITHRICGPLVNFTRTFNRLARGDFSQKVSLRKTDYLKVESEAINHMIECMANRFQIISEDHERIINVLENSLISITDPKTRSEIDNVIEELKKLINPVHEL